MKIVGLSCGAHDTSYCVYENGKIIIHEEFERFSRVKEQRGDVLDFLFKQQKNLEDVNIFTHFFMKWNNGLKSMFIESFQKLEKLMNKSGAKYLEVSHHKAHAANAFFSSDFRKSLILSIDGGGEETNDGIHKTHESSFVVFKGENNKIEILQDRGTNPNIGHLWSKITKEVFGLSNGPPIGNQCGTVMAMAAVAKDIEKFKNDMNKYIRNEDFNILNKWVHLSENDKFNLAGSLQKCTEEYVIEILKPIFEKNKFENLCIVGGVALNGLLNRAILKEFDFIKNIFVPPVPYDAGLSIGCCQYIYYHELNFPRSEINKENSAYLGRTYSNNEILASIEKSNLSWKYIEDSSIIELLDNQKIIAIFRGGSESGRRALGNRSIFADPRSYNMKDLINEKVKHRQWFRPFAPVIIREEVPNWFEMDIDSPYMNIILSFKKSKRQLVPAVVHFDGTGRLQTVSQNNNIWLYNFLKKWEDKSKVPILLNTSFNDREPIVETPYDAIRCFKKTKIDYLWFADAKILVEKNEK